jgi:CCR4-NOT transcription complex subunit 1
LGRHEKELVRDIRSTFLQIAQKSGPPQNNLVEAPELNSAQVTFKQEIEDEANSYYERIYSGEITIDEMIQQLYKFRTSNDTREQEIFACMIHNLFDEYHFFPKYPDKELGITSILFGSLIQNQLVAYAPLGMALRYVLDALGNPPGSKMYNFGLQALNQFKSRLPEWPQFCTHLIQIPSLQQTNPELAAFIKQASRMADEELTLPDTSQVMVETASVFTAIYVPEIPACLQQHPIHYVTPNEQTQDKILFIINNVALNNLNSKSSELKEQLEQTAYQWFGHYLVVKRASIEPNYHELYLLLLKSVNSRLLYQHVLRETFANIKILLNSENTVSSSSERALLKNLGAWLGGMTLAQNSPIKQKYISFKDLLLEGYDTNRLIVVIPFVCKVLEQGTKNKVFVPPNPWVMAILKLLVELYQHANLKLNLKFEIEVLCKTLSVELNCKCYKRKMYQN